MEMRVLSWGAVIRDLVVPSPAGPQPVVLGLDSIDDYAAHSPYFGAIVGRYANRIGRARFILDGDHVSARPRTTAAISSMAARAVSARALGRSSITQPPASRLALVSQDGDMGYPGRLLGDLHLYASRIPPHCASISKRSPTGARPSISPTTPISTSTAARISARTS